MDNIDENDDSLIGLYKSKGVEEIYCIKRGIILKSQKESWWGPEILSAERRCWVGRLQHCFRVEEQILQALRGRGTPIPFHPDAL